MPGVFILVEGPEGAGKTSLARWISARLLAEGRTVVSVREPGGTPVAEAARKIALKSTHDLAPAAELFLILAARADLVTRVIKPALEAGDIVVADRFGLSTLCYQVAGRGLPRAEVTAALQLATQGVTPHLTLVLDVPVAVGRARQRRARKTQDRFESADDAFHERVRQAYLDCQGPGVAHLDATQPKRTVREAAWQEVAAATALSLRGIA